METYGMTQDIYDEIFSFAKNNRTLFQRYMQSSNIEFVGRRKYAVQFQPFSGRQIILCTQEPLKSSIIPVLLSSPMDESFNSQQSQSSSTKISGDR